MNKSQINNDTGFVTLDAISKADRFNEWSYQTIKPFLKGRVLEVGSGIGNMSRYLLSDFKEVILSDISEDYVRILNEKFKPGPDQRIIELDISLKDFKEKYSGFNKAFDSLILSNVLEHIEDEDQVLENCRFLLKEEGCLIVIVPAFKRLYNSLDRQLLHFKRYEEKELKYWLLKKGVKPIYSQYFNLGGILGWFFYGGILHKTHISYENMNMYNKLVPFFKLLDKISFNKWGLSLIVIGEKK